MADAPEPLDEPERRRPFLRPYTVVISVVFMVTALVMAFTMLPEEWSFWRRLAGGLFGGVGAILLVIGNRYIGRSESI